MSDTPRVLHVVESLEIGGLERLVHDLAIARGGDSTSVACLATVGPFGEALRKRGIAVELVGTEKGVLVTLWRMWRLLRKMRPAVVHCHNFRGLLNGGLAAHLAGDIRVVMTKHGVDLPKTRLTRRLNRFLARHADVVAVSREVMDIMSAWIARANRRVHCIANGIAMFPYENLPSREEARTRLGLPARIFIVGIIGRVTLAKGHVMLIDVFARILPKLQGALLLIVGDGAGLPAVRARIQELRIEKSVMVLGARQDVPSILAAMDVFCLPSESEGMPMTVLEAMAAGLPVVTSNVGGLPEVVDEGLTGLMVPPRAPDQLEAALLALAGNPQRAQKMGLAGREKLIEELSLERTLAAYEELYVQARQVGAEAGKVKVNHQPAS